MENEQKSRSVILKRFFCAKDLPRCFSCKGRPFGFFTMRNAVSRKSHTDGDHVLSIAGDPSPKRGLRMTAYAARISTGKE